MTGGIPQRFLRWHIGHALDKGRRRSQKPNEDALAVVKPSLFRRGLALLVVADGMGGHEGGQVASRTAIAASAASFKRARGALPEELVPSIISAAHNALLRRAQQHVDLHSMGTTIVLALLGPGFVVIGNAGDSRAYLVSNEQASQLSHDHSVVADLVRAGELSPQDVRGHALRSQVNLSLSPRRATVEPFVARYQVAPADAVVLCTDGLWATISEAEIAAVVAELTPKEAAKKLVQLANASAGPDNIAVIVATYGR